MKQFGILDMALSAVFLAAKLEEHPLRLRDLINAFDVIKKRVDHEKASISINKAKAKARSLTQHNSSHSSEASLSSRFHYTPMDYFDKLFYDMKEEAVIGEMQILKRLGFNLIIKHPYGHLVNYLQVLDLASHPTVPQRAWGFVNDLLGTSMPATQPPAALACAGIYLACLETSQPTLNTGAPSASPSADPSKPTLLPGPIPPETPPVVLPMHPRPWWELFGVRSQAQIWHVVLALLDFYRRWSLDRQRESSDRPLDDVPQNVWVRAASMNLPLTKSALREQLSSDGR